ncbi:AraC family transcriptional regulator [Loigolactobacillus zhaoyuanensis]|uniref:AraC family transcriptional regulator n=1 Tax=Loigolactobacillus zhaoyuanensis TaxID=2486017 RepID=UPI000F7364A3|nr:AraC family transcriptional regulator [Loigolactobacillus zhaoyuanensis]
MTKNLQYTSKIDFQFDQLVYNIGSYHYNWHQQVELLWLLQGEIEVNVDGNRYVLSENDLIIINSNCGHATFALKPNSIALRIHIMPDFFTNQGFDLNVGQFTLNSASKKFSPAYPIIRHALACLYLGMRANTNKLTINSLFYQLANELAQYFFADMIQGSRTITQKSHFLDTTTHYIDEHYQEDITLEKLADYCNYSSSYLSKLFKLELGINFYEYLVRCRLQHAVTDLTHTTLKVVDVAYHNGFKEVKSFNLMFKKHFGQTPSDYRRLVSPELISQDHDFKKQLSPQLQEIILQKLSIFAQNKKELLFIDPCDNCEFKGYEQKYHQLVNNLQEIINH